MGRRGTARKRVPGEIVSWNDFSHSESVLMATLESAVPLRVAELAQMSAAGREEQIRAWADAAAQPLHEEADILMCGGGKRGQAAKVFNHLARALAAGAYQPGGVTFNGRHWCADHAACEAAKVAVESVGAA